MDVNWRRGAIILVFRICLHMNHYINFIAEKKKQLKVIKITFRPFLKAFVHICFDK